MVDRAHVINIIGVTPFNHSLVEMACFVFDAKEIVTTPAVEPMGVPFPPHPTPKAKAQKRGIVASPISPR